jgi:hypothetical protein
MWHRYKCWSYHIIFLGLSDKIRFIAIHLRLDRAIKVIRLARIIPYFRVPAYFLPCLSRLRLKSLNSSTVWLEMQECHVGGSTKLRDIPPLQGISRPTSGYLQVIIGFNVSYCYPVPLIPSQVWNSSKGSTELSTNIILPSGSQHDIGQGNVASKLRPIAAVSDALHCNYVVYAVAKCHAGAEKEMEYSEVACLRHPLRSSLRPANKKRKANMPSRGTLKKKGLSSG